MFQTEDQKSKFLKKGDSGNDLTKKIVEEMSKTRTAVMKLFDCENSENCFSPNVCRMFKETTNGMGWMERQETEAKVVTFIATLRKGADNDARRGMRREEQTLCPRSEPGPSMGYVPFNEEDSDLFKLH
ncbi:Protein CBG26270 [Caenorhabditis briggsae]|uniref:Uncharacterized protein n=2 Tax=Caenorhabditis briggsae TaxID=6238 RepID=A0AAE9A905_CAEBR|nr:Protein CBG26270 [Caenorhabditis briggsae]ULT93835.1 hypothetical protein L3Y34_003382 [Caenorhabditis briggsae]CAS00975.1 Protein CBG26270 [Caenorhabditis briggsae]